MAQYIGFSTKDACKPKSTNPIPQSGALAKTGPGAGTITQPVVWGKKYRLVDAQLVIQDFVNAMNIPLGQKVGQPGYGTNLWNFIFEPNTPDIQAQIQNEVKRVASLDPRLHINYVKAYPQENGILIEIQLSVIPYNTPLVLNVFFNQQNNTATIQ